MLDTYPAEEVVRLLPRRGERGYQGGQGLRRLEIAQASRLLAERLAAGSRLVYVGVGTAGRVAALEAAECVPLFGLPPSLVVSVLAGGPHALARTVEIAQDSRREAEQRMRKVAVGPGDVVCAVADLEVSVFLRAAIEYARFRRAHIVLVTCTQPPAADDGGALADILIQLDPGPEIIAGATRLKAATAIKLALSALSSAAFVQLGKTYGGLMVDVRPTTPRTWKRAIQIVTSPVPPERTRGREAHQEGGRQGESRPRDPPCQGQRVACKRASRAAPRLSARNRGRYRSDRLDLTVACRAHYLAGHLAQYPNPNGALVRFCETNAKESRQPMKKSDLVDLVAQKLNFPRPQVEQTIESLLDAVADGLAKGERVDIRGFGAFQIRESAARSGRNPRTGETIQIAARKTPTFKVGKELRDKVNGVATL